jgi:hypothetical protein
MSLILPTGASWFKPSKYDTFLGEGALRVDFLGHVTLLGGRNLLRINHQDSASATQQVDLDRVYSR